MRNYITINGIKSDSVKGLMIQSLPPISKPLVRTSTEEIDGRDGDIVTKLGYSAYDKEVKIGLYGDFDVNDAIRFFNSSGEVVFSNEPDKYYRFQILQQIDFERLIRYRTATVKFHVQPYKYSDVDRVIEFTDNYITVRRFGGVLNGLAVESDGTITVKGTAKQTTSFYIPIVPITLESGEYDLKAVCSGAANGCTIQLIHDLPSNSFGNSYVALKDGSSSDLTGTADGNTTYNYLWLYIPNGTTVNSNIAIQLKSMSLNSMTVYNRGNIYSSPKITIYGSGTVEFSINSTLVLSMNIDSEYIIIDAERMEAYHEDTLKNRNVKGDYSKIRLNCGKNVISWNGTVDSITLENFSRWI